MDWTSTRTRLAALVVVAPLALLAPACSTPVETLASAPAGSAVGSASRGLTSTQRSIAGYAAGDRFGAAVAQRGDLSVIGAAGRNSDTGAVKLAWPWGLGCIAGSCAHAPGSDTLVASDAVPGTRFGRAVAFGGDVLLAGAVLAVGAVGSVYIYRRRGVEPNGFALEKKLVEASSGFGASVAYSGNTLAIGRDGDASGNGAAAVVHVWVINQWFAERSFALTKVTKVNVAIEGDTLAVGSTPLNTPPYCYVGSTGGCGRVTVYRRTGGSWNSEFALVGLDRQRPDYTGRAVAFASNTLVVGDYGRAHIYRRTGATWAAEAIVAPATPSSGFGSAVAVSGRTVLVGDPTDAGKGAAAGAVYVFIRGANGWTERAKLVAQAGAAGDGFGSAVAAGDQTIALAGAPAGASATGYAVHAHFTLAASGASCTRDNDCLSGLCADGVCCANACNTLCHTCQTGSCVAIAAGVEDTFGAKTCASTSACDGNGTCKRKNGQACSDGAQCLDGRCVDGYCCNSACTGICRACNIAGMLGTCSPLSGKRDPGTCDGVCGVCDAGLCKAVPKGGEVSEAPACNGNSACDGTGLCKTKNGRSCTTGAECVSGHCADGVCCDSACTGECRTCVLPRAAGTCTPLDGARDADTCSGVCSLCNAGVCTPIARGTDVLGGALLCDGDKTCDGRGGCRTKNGRSCKSASDCVSGHCADDGSGKGTKVCCTTACDQPCRVCGANGICTNAPAGFKRKGDCTSKDATCGGACDGKGGCVYPGLDTACGRCKACDGAGDCTGTPKDDKGCGTIDCSLRRHPDRCLRYADVTSERCAAFGQCKRANAAATCVETEPSKAPGCVDAGLPDASIVDSGGATGDGGADAAAGDGSPEKRLGCECALGDAGGAGSQTTLLLMLLLGAALLRSRAARRRRKTGE